MAIVGVNIDLTAGRAVVRSAGPPGVDSTTLLTDITTALAAANATHDSTPEITTVQTDALALAATLNSAGLGLYVDTTKITTRNQLLIALDEALRYIRGSTIVS